MKILAKKSLLVAAVMVGFVGCGSDQAAKKAAAQAKAVADAKKEGADEVQAQIEKQQANVEKAAVTADAEVLMKSMTTLEFKKTAAVKKKISELSKNRSQSYVDAVYRAYQIQLAESKIEELAKDPSRLEDKTNQEKELVALKQKQHDEIVVIAGAEKKSEAQVTAEIKADLEAILKQMQADSEKKTQVNTQNSQTQGH